MNDVQDDTRTLAETSVEKMRVEELSFGDFPDSEIDLALDAMCEECKGLESGGRRENDADWNAIEKGFLIFHNAGTDSFDGKPYQSDFYNVYLSDYARENVPGYDPGAGSSGKGAIDYDRSYYELQLIIEVLDGTFAVYMKDYTMGHIRNLGACVYGYESVDVPDEHMGQWNEIQLSRRILPYLEALFLSGEINLAEEIYDYYHTIPDVDVRLIQHRLNDLVSVQEAASMLDVSAARVKKMLADRVLDGFKHNGRLWLSKAAVQERVDYIAEHGKPTRGKKKEVVDLRRERAPR